MTGLKRKAFDELLQAFCIQLELEAIANSQKPRLRTGRRRDKSTMAAGLRQVLFSSSSIFTFDVAGVLFDLYRSRAHYWMLRLQPLPLECFQKKMALPERNLQSIEEFITRFPSTTEMMIDVKERPIEPPKDYQKQKHHYSGKKKYHTCKHLIIKDSKKRVFVLSSSREGKVHDKRQLDEEKLVDFVPSGGKK
ncbi:MAG: IS5/IS1182 family transposase [Trichodesmium sp. St18_bin3_1_1]|nr:IS5/IS1182 family transposase [Trichodesmium sp. St4_bin8_1]MDE5074107.1 IS5/IS1182 family transposase [Trichodesmium sp. St5_bin8]MDE5092159.1 IS5/IS1182 family transposase [Trichodesmium sp. St18_bin3_1_1]